MLCVKHLSYLRDSQMAESGSHQMESDIRYYARRAAQEQLAAKNAVSAEARQRRLALVTHFQAKLAELRA